MKYKSIFRGQIRNNVTTCGQFDSMLGKISADDILKYFLIFPRKYISQKVYFDSSCKLSPQEAICMKCQSLFSVNINKKKKT